MFNYVFDKAEYVMAGEALKLPPKVYPLFVTVQCRAISEDLIAKWTGKLGHG